MSIEPHPRDECNNDKGKYEVPPNQKHCDTVSHERCSETEGTKLLADRLAKIKLICWHLRFFLFQTKAGQVCAIRGIFAISCMHLEVSERKIFKCVSVVFIVGLAVDGWVFRALICLVLTCLENHNKRGEQEARHHYKDYKSALQALAPCEVSVFPDDVGGLACTLYFEFIWAARDAEETAQVTDCRAMVARHCLLETKRAHDPFLTFKSHENADRSGKSRLVLSQQLVNSLVDLIKVVPLLALYQSASFLQKLNYGSVVEGQRGESNLYISHRLIVELQVGTARQLMLHLFCDPFAEKVRQCLAWTSLVAHFKRKIFVKLSANWKFHCVVAGRNGVHVPRHVVRLVVHAHKLKHNIHYKCNEDGKGGDHEAQLPSNDDLILCERAGHLDEDLRA